MSMRLAKRSSVAVLSLAIGAAAWSQPASAEQYLFDMLFGNGQRTQQAEPDHRRQVRAPHQRQQRRVSPRQRQTRQQQQTHAPNREPSRQQRRPVEVPKVSSPSFYDYRPDGPVKLDISQLKTGIPEEGRTSSFSDALSTLSDVELLAEEKIADAVVEHYSSRPEFLWIEGDQPNERARAVLRILQDAGEFGLSETDYVVSLPGVGPGASMAEEERLSALMRFELMLSARALRYARDAYKGRVDPNKLSGYHDFPEKPLEEERVLGVLASSPDPARFLEALHPENATYAALTEELKDLHESPEKEIVVAPDTFVRPGGSHPEFSKILRIIDRDADEEFREEHGDVLAAHLGNDTYAQDLVPVIKAAQAAHDLNTDGIVGPQTVNSLAGDTNAKRIEKVQLALERLRWHPSRLGNTRVMINAAGFEARYIEDRQEKLSMRTVVGTRSNQTSFFHDEIEYVEYNPYWGVPRSIIVNEMLPKLRRNPYYLDERGYEVTDSRGRQVSSAAVDWWAHGRNIPYNVRQKPGSSNALGALKIMFPNEHAIYMHDTPQKALFERDTRAYSHGCVRLQEPRKMAAAVLETSTDEVDRKIAQGQNTRQDMEKSIPVYVGYFTAWPEASGTVEYHRDVYKRDENLKKALMKVEETRSAGS